MSLILVTTLFYELLFTGVCTLEICFVGYDFGNEEATELKVDVQKDLIVQNILNLYHLFSQKRDFSREHFSENLEKLMSW